MATIIRPEVSKKNEFWIPKHRYYELKHFCYQFWDWQRRRALLDGMATKENREPTESEAIERAVLDEKIKMVMTAAYQAAGDMDRSLLECVTKGRTYEDINARKYIGCGRDKFYKMYRKFFFLLDAMRN